MQELETRQKLGKTWATRARLRWSGEMLPIVFDGLEKQLFPESILGSKEQRFNCLRFVLKARIHSFDRCVELACSCRATTNSNERPSFNE
jgi:hypothetical protein